MKSLFMNIRSLKAQYVLFISTVVLTIVVSQFIIQYHLSEQNKDAYLINIAGRQRMLSQRISKLAFYIRDDIAAGNLDRAKLDTLKNLVNHWQHVHSGLANGNPELDLSNRKSKTIDSLLTAISPHLSGIVQACFRLIDRPDLPTVEEAVKTISQHELDFLYTMERTVDTYQREAEKKLSGIKNVELSLAIASVVVLLLEFIFIFFPMVRGLKNANKQLVEGNQELKALNEELQSAEEELRSNLDYVNALGEKLEMNERQFRGVVENATDLIYELDENGKFTYANPVMESICGYTKEVLRDKYYWDLVHPDHRKDVVTFYRQQLVARTEATYLEFPIIPHNGSLVWVGQNVRMYFRNHWVFKVSVVARDITTLVQAREALLASESLFRSLTENAPVGIVQTNVKGEAIYVNSRWCEITGIDKGLAMGNRWVKSIHEEDAQKVFEALQLALTNQHDFDNIFRLNTPAGIRWVRYKATPTINGDNEFTGYIGTLSDITGIKEAERVSREAKEKAEEATLAKSQFLSMMSHEIRTPMNGIVGITNLLILENPRSDQQENLRLLKFSGEHLLTIINDILDFSKIEAGKITLEYLDFDLPALLDNLHQMLDQRAREKGINLILNYCKTAPSIVKGDQVRIGQVINNLVANAIKFTEKGHVELAVTSVKADEHKHALTFSIKDTGIGIEPEKLKHIFESFSQGNSNTTRKFGGTGLGLSITKKLLNLMESEIEVKSTPGAGSEFSFTLILEEGVLRAPAAQQKLAEISSNTGKKIKVLLAEDNRVNQIVASNFLRKWGLEVDFANHGKEALELVRNKSYQLILMDLQMPEMDGYETSSRIRSLGQDPYFKEIPIIALTASAMIDIKDKAISAGMNDFISKPFLPEELQSKIAHYINVAKPIETEAGQEKAINLDLYTEGDPEFKRELAGLLIKNLRELQRALVDSLQLKDPEIYRKASHKVKPTISMLDKSFLQLVEEIKVLLINNAISEPFEEKRKDFDNVSDKLILELQEMVN